MFNLRLKTKVTFSFDKLSKKLDKIISKTQRRSLRFIADTYKKNITEKTYIGKKTLEKSTKKRRRYKGHTPEYPNTVPRDTSTPLQATGNLLKSIRVTNKGISYNAYGEYHVEGVVRPRRNWRRLTGRKGHKTVLSEKNLEKFKTDIRKGFRLAGRGKNIRQVRL